MANGGCNNSAGNDVVELEAMRKDSFSWHPCQVSLSSIGLGLIVQYGDNYLDEIIPDKEGVLARIRVRSTPLQGDDCSSLQQGDHVLATKNSPVKGVFFDARVEAAIRVRHSKRIHCRCSFTIKWLHQALEGEALTVPASAIMKLATKSISLHPTISTFFSMLESSSGLDTLPFSTTVDSMNWEMDIDVLLEKQIEDISNSTDVSQKKISNNYIFGLEVDLKGQSQGRQIDASLKVPCVEIPLLNTLKGSTGSEHKQPVETTIETPPAFISSSEEEITGCRSPLNPLAARAALASLRSKLPQSAELSIQSNVEEGYITSEHSAAKLLYGSKCCSFSAVDRSSITDDFSLNISATLGGKSPKVEGIVKTLFPTSSDPQIVEFANMPSTAQVKGTEKKNQNSVKEITSSETRFTCAQIKRNTGMHESTQMAKTGETQFMLPSKTRRVTRSTADGAEKTKVKESNGEIQENIPTKFVQLDTSAQNSIALQKYLSDNKKPVASPIDGETNICSAENDCYLGKDGMIAKVDSQKGTFAEDAEKHNYPKRLTRSTAQEVIEKNNVQPKLKFSKSKSSALNVLDLFEGNVSPERNISGLERSIISPIATKFSAQFTEEGENKETFTHLKTTPSSEASAVGSSQGVKRKSACSKKQEKRFSPRLRYLPRTRSQNKA